MNKLPLFLGGSRKKTSELELNFKRKDSWANKSFLCFCYFVGRRRSESSQWVLTMNAFVGLKVHKSANVEKTLKCLNQMRYFL